MNPPVDQVTLPKSSTMATPAATTSDDPLHRFIGTFSPLPTGYLNADAKLESPIPEADNFCSPETATDCLVQDDVAVHILKTLLMQASDCIAVKDSAGRYLLINPAGANFLGKSVLEIIGKTDYELFVPEMAQAIIDSDQQVMLSGETALFEDFLRPLNGKTHYFQAMKCPYRLPSGGNALGVINVVRDISEAKAAEQALINSNHDLEMFTALASHDLQAPLRKIMYFSEALTQECPELSETAGDYLARIQKTAQKMGKLVQDMLYLSKAQQSKIRFTTVNLMQLVEEAIQEISPEPKSFQDYFVLDGLDIDFMADGLQIRQLLVNIFGNAIKFQRSDTIPRIEVRAEITPFQQCLVSIRDNGIGFDMQDEKNLFSAFERLSNARFYSGSGLGLAICERIVQRHFGRIRAESKLNEGTVFYIELPLRQD